MIDAFFSDIENGFNELETKDLFDEILSGLKQENSTGGSLFLDLDRILGSVILDSNNSLMDFVNTLWSKIGGYSYYGTDFNSSMAQRFSTVMSGGDVTVNQDTPFIDAFSAELKLIIDYFNSATSYLYNFNNEAFALNKTLDEFTGNQSEYNAAVDNYLKSGEDLIDKYSGYITSPESPLAKALSSFSDSLKSREFIKDYTDILSEAGSTVKDKIINLGELINDAAQSGVDVSFGSVFPDVFAKNIISSLLDSAINQETKAAADKALFSGDNVQEAKIDALISLYESLYDSNAFSTDIIESVGNKISALVADLKRVNIDEVISGYKDIAAAYETYLATYFSDSFIRLPLWYIWETTGNPNDTASFVILPSCLRSSGCSLPQTVHPIAIASAPSLNASSTSPKCIS